MVYCTQGKANEGEIVVSLTTFLLKKKKRKEKKEKEKRNKSLLNIFLDHTPKLCAMWT